MNDFNFRLAAGNDKETILAFLHTHWDASDPFADNPVFFRYYFEEDDGRLRFALAESNKKIVALAGYIPANRLEKPDIWISFWVADSAAPGVGLELMAAIPELTGCRTMACNNIRPKTRVFYEFLGFSTGRFGHYYRLANRAQYHLAQVGRREILPVFGGLELRLLPDGQALQNSGFTPPTAANPYKDLWYILRRYYAYPQQTYAVHGVYEPGGFSPLALLTTRVIQAEGGTVLRITDYLGEAALLPRLGLAIDRLMQENGVEYADFYCSGISTELLRQMGFCEREEGDNTNILPNYLQPPLLENTDYYYFTNLPDEFRICKADGDQDRPRM